MRGDKFPLIENEEGTFVSEYNRVPATRNHKIDSCRRKVPKFLQFLPRSQRFLATIKIVCLLTRFLRRERPGITRSALRALQVDELLIQDGKVHPYGDFTDFFPQIKKD